MLGSSNSIKAIGIQKLEEVSILLRKCKFVSSLTFPHRCNLLLLEGSQLDIVEDPSDELTFPPTDDVAV